MCSRVALVCASGDRRKNVVCVTWCAKVRGLPARPIKSGWFDRSSADDVTFQQMLVYSFCLTNIAHHRQIQRSDSVTARANDPCLLLIF